MYNIVIGTNLAEDRGIGLIVNFAACIIICELDDIIMSTARIQRIKDEFENQKDESEDKKEKKKRDYSKLKDRKYTHCGYLKILVPKKESLGYNQCLCVCCFDSY